MKPFDYRDSMEHLILIKAHMLSLKSHLKQLPELYLKSSGLVSLRQGYLDLRMIIEEMMLLSVSAHREAGLELSKTLQQNYSAEKKMQLLERVNSKFFPEAIRVVPSDEDGIEGVFAAVEEEHLTRELAKEYYCQSGNFLHASSKIMGEKEYFDAVTRLERFQTLTSVLLHTFEVDISGRGMLVAGHLQLEEVGAPMIFSARYAD